MADPERKFPYGLVLGLLGVLIGNTWVDYRIAAREGSAPLRLVAHVSMLFVVIAIIICAAWWRKWRRK